MSELERLLMLYTGDKPDGSRFKGAMGLGDKDAHKLLRLLIEERGKMRAGLKRIVSEGIDTSTDGGTVYIKSLIGEEALGGSFKDTTDPTST